MQLPTRKKMCPHGSLEVLVEQDFSVVVYNADVHGRSVQVDPAVELALLIVGLRESGS